MYQIYTLKLADQLATMVFYECVVTAKNTTRELPCEIVCDLSNQLLLVTPDFYMLTNVVKAVSHEVVKGGGIVRSVHNHGIRTLPHRFQAKFPDKQGNRYYTKGRFFSIYYDANPQTMKQVEQVLVMDEEVLRTTHLKARSPFDVVNIMKEHKNPYIQQIKEEEKLESQAKHERNETVENVIEDMRLDDA